MSWHDMARVGEGMGEVTFECVEGACYILLHDMLYRMCTEFVPSVCRACTKRAPNVYRTCTERIPKVYRTCDELVPNVYRKCTERVPNVYLGIYRRIGLPCFVQRKIDFATPPSPPPPHYTPPILKHII